MAIFTPVFFPNVLVITKKKKKKKKKKRDKYQPPYYIKHNGLRQSLGSLSKSPVALVEDRKASAVMIRSKEIIITNAPT